MQVKKLDYFDKSTYDAIKAKLQQMGRRRRNAVLGERLNIEASRLNRENVTKVDAKQEGFALGPKGRFHKAKRLKDPPPWGETSPNITKKGNLKVTFVSGERGIRTPGTSQCGSFQDCCNRPLYHLSRRPLWAAFLSKAMQRYGVFAKRANFWRIFSKKSLKKLIFLYFCTHEKGYNSNLVHNFVYECFCSK